MNQTQEIQELTAQYEKLRVMYSVYEKEIQESTDEFEKNFMIEMRAKVGEQMKAIVLKKIQIKVDNHMKKETEETITITKEEDEESVSSEESESSASSVSSEESEESETQEEAHSWFRSNIHKYTIMCFSKEKRTTKFDFNFSRNFPFTQQEKGSTPKSFVYECIFENRSDFETAQDITLFNMDYKDKNRFKWFYFCPQILKQPKEVNTYINIENNQEIPIESISIYNTRYDTTRWYYNKKIVINGRDCELEPIFPSWNQKGEPAGIPKFYIRQPDEIDFQEVRVADLQIGDIYKNWSNCQEIFYQVVKITAAQIQYQILPSKKLGVSGDYFGFYKNWEQYEVIVPNPNQNIHKMNKISKFRGQIEDNKVKKFIGTPTRMISYYSGDGGR